MKSIRKSYRDDPEFDRLDALIAIHLGLTAQKWKALRALWHLRVGTMYDIGIEAYGEGVKTSPPQIGNILRTVKKRLAAHGLTIEANGREGGYFMPAETHDALAALMEQMRQYLENKK